MEPNERLLLSEERVANLEKRLDGVCTSMSISAQANSDIFTKIIERMSNLIWVVILFAFISGVNATEGFLRMLGVVK
jgi:hypothetical protein